MVGPLSGGGGKTTEPLRKITRTSWNTGKRRKKTCLLCSVLVNIDQPDQKGGKRGLIVVLQCMYKEEHIFVTFLL